MSSKSSQMPSDLMEALMKDPVKRAMILQLLTKEKDGFEAYKRREERKSAGTPLRKVQRMHCESPTALQRRRALAQLNEDTTSASSSSDLSDVVTEVKGPKLPFDQLLTGVKAYVEVKRNNVDRSDGIKAVMKLMGATIKDQFTNDVTHVVFKDGSFPTYQKAKLLKVHLVSVLWLDAVRRNNARVPEKNYPAFGNRVPEEEVSILCSQLQKDYEEVIKDEKRRSMSILPESSRKSVEKNRRKTMMTPQTSKSSYLTAHRSSLLFPDEESRSKSNSPDLTSDDSDCGVIDGQVSKRPKDRVDLTQITPDMTDDLESGGSESLVNRVTTINNRRTIHVTTDMVITPNMTEKNRQIDKMGNTNRVLQNVSIQSSLMSSLRVSSTSSDRTKSGLEKSKTRDNSLATIGTTMSSLRLSDSLEKNEEKQTKSKTRKSKSSSKENSPEFDRNVTKRSRGRSVSVARSTANAKSAEEEKSETNIRTTRRSVSAAKSTVNAKSAAEEKSEANNGRTRRSVSLLRAGSEDETEGKDRPGAAHHTKNRGRSLSVILSRSETGSGLLLSKTGNQSDTDDFKNVTTSRSKSEIRKTVGKTPKSTSTKITKKKKRLSSSMSELEDNKLTESSEKSEQANSSISGSEIGEKPGKKSTSSSRTLSGLLDDYEDQMEILKESRSRRPSTCSSRSRLDDKSTKKATPIKSGSVRSRRASSVTSSKSESAVRKATGCADQMEIVEESRSRRESTSSSRSELDHINNKKTSSAKPESRNRRASSVASSRSESAVRRVNSRKSVTPRRSSTPPATNPSPAKRSRVQETAKKRRPLFNPDDMIDLPRSQDDQEREEYFKRKAKKSPKDVFVNPNDVVITPLSKKKTKEVDLDESMESINWSSDEGKKKEETPKKQKKKRAKDKTPPPRDSSADEQRDLLDLLTRKVDQGAQSRRSERILISQVKPKYTFSSSFSDSQSTSSLPITPIKRRSTLDFQTVSQTQQKLKLRLDLKRPSSIACTKMHRYEVYEFEKIVKDLGMFFVEYQVTDRTTHLVAGESKRTINMLRAIARGCWILKPEWLQKSKKAGKWLSEEDYEDTGFSPAVQQCRLQRQAFGPKYSMDIFKECGWIYVAKSTTPRSEDLTELITTCQGKVTSIYRNAEIVVGEFIRGKEVTCVTELWVLDSITFNKLEPLKNYLIKKPVGVDSPHY